MSTADIFERLDDPTDHLFGLDATRRMLVLSSIDLDDVGLRAQLDAITARTADRLGLPSSLVTLVLDTAQVLAGSHGVPEWIVAAGGTPVEWSFCAHTVSRGGPYVVTDATTDPAHADNPLVTVDGVTSYAGVPLVIDGQVLGAHCVLGGHPRTFSEADLAELREAADDIVALLERHRLPSP
jgi:GAF domain-containing protein